MKARKEKANEIATIAEPPGISHWSALNPARARARAKDSKENSAIVEEVGHPARDRPKNEGGAKGTWSKGGYKGAWRKEDPKGRAKASGKLMEMKPKETLTGSSRRRKKQRARVRQRRPWRFKRRLGIS